MSRKPGAYDEVGWALLQDRLEPHIEAAKAAGEKMFMGKPDAWYEAHRWRCCNDHVSGAYLRTEFGPRCFACGEPVLLSFPGDCDGPITKVEARQCEGSSHSS